MQTSRLAALMAVLMGVAIASSANAGIMAPEAGSPGACPPEVRQNKDCARWYELNEKQEPDACTPRRMYGEKCGRWYSVGAPAPKEEVIVLRGINFDTAKADIKADSIPILQKNVKGLQAKPRAQIVIEGHTDSRGGDAYNQKLSEARANSVLNWFAQNGVDRNRMTAIGKGETQPVGSNTTQEGMYQNRRIELHLR